MNEKTFLDEYKNYADEQTLNKILQYKIKEENSIDLDNCEIYNLSPLKSCIQLKYLRINSTPVSDLKPLVGFELKEIYINNTNVIDLKPLGKTPTLKRISLGKTLIDDISPLKNLINLHSLYLNNMPIEDLSPLKDLSLSVLDISFTKVKTLSPLNEIGSLLANNTDIIDLIPLKSKKRLKILDVSSTKINDISPLKDLPFLIMLKIENTNVTDLSPLSSFIQKKRIKLYCNGEKCYSGIYVKGCPLSNPPVNILEKGKQEVLNYWGLEEIENQF